MLGASATAVAAAYTDRSQPHVRIVECALEQLFQEFGSHPGPEGPDPLKEHLVAEATAYYRDKCVLNRRKMEGGCARACCCACVRACVRACVCVCVRVCVCACVHAFMR